MRAFSDHPLWVGTCQPSQAMLGLPLVSICHIPLHFSIQRSPPFVECAVKCIISHRFSGLEIAPPPSAGAALRPLQRCIKTEPFSAQAGRGVDSVPAVPTQIPAIRVPQTLRPLHNYHLVTHWLTLALSGMRLLSIGCCMDGLECFPLPPNRSQWVKLHKSA